MVRLLMLLAAALLGAVLVRQPSVQTSWAEGSPDSWVNLDLSTIQDSSAGYICPMDRDVTSKTPGFCPRCRMKLVKMVAGALDPQEYPVLITAPHGVIKPGENTQLNFRIEDPKTQEPVSDFEIVHEKPYHLFVVSQDLSFFLHTHPEEQADASFHLDLRVPKAGMYRILSDFYPKGGTPQLVANTLMVPGIGFKLAPAKLVPDLAPQHAENMDVELVTEPARPAAHGKAMLSFRIKPNNGIEPYLGAMAHMLMASSDLIDMVHSHPLQVTDHGADYKELQFKMTFPRVGVYRVWVQSQRKGVVNTVAFNIPVSE